MTVRPMLAAFLLGTTMLSAAADAGPLPNGIEAANGSAKIQVTALTDNILRVRIGKGGAFAEDASWAVPAVVRKQSAAVTATAATRRRTLREEFRSAGANSWRRTPSAGLPEFTILRLAYPQASLQWASSARTSTGSPSISARTECRIVMLTSGTERHNAQYFAAS